MLDRNKGVGPGFDYLRIGLALVIFLIHAKAVANGRPPGEVAAPGGNLTGAQEAWGTFRDPFYIAIVPMFFALSGFLVTGSACRLQNVRAFLIFRGLRIFPALSIEVLLSAFILGPLCTSHSTVDYFDDPELLRYLGNILGFVTFFLPGVFADNPVPGIVNNNLWTLPAEFYCYLILSIGMLTGVAYKRISFSWLFCTATAVLIVVSLCFGYQVEHGTYHTPVITYYFFMGCFLYHWRHYIPYNPILTIVAGVIAYLCLATRGAVFLGPVFLTYVTVVLGAINWRKIDLIKKNDYSYGIYLYGFPISQAFIAFLPQLRGHPDLTRALAGIITVVFAAVSWHFLERPALQLKNRFSRPTLPQPVPAMSGDDKRD